MTEGRATRSAALFERARQALPGGVSSPARSFGAVGGTPRFIARARGATVWDVDGLAYLDFVGSWGPLILGHAHPDVVRAIAEQAERGTSYGAPTEVEVRLAEAIRTAMPVCERVRFVNSGTEATMSALRLARAVTGRDGIVKFAGCYHGHSDFLLVQAGSGATTFGIPTSPGVPADAARHTLVAPYNDAGAVRRLFEAHPDRIAAVIVEPVAGNMGVVPPAPGFLEALRAVTAEHGALLIFDEVITGFRVAPGGAVERYGVTPDLVTLGKVIGGGLPVGAYGGPARLMEWLAPIGPVYQAGTLSGNPLAMAAGLATLERLRDRAAYAALEARTEAFCRGLSAAARRAGVPLAVQQVGSMFTPFFTGRPVTDYASAKAADAARYARWFHACLEGGAYFPPSQFEAAFVSFAHSDADLERALDVAATALQRVAAEGAA